MTSSFAPAINSTEPGRLAELKTCHNYSSFSRSRSIFPAMRRPRLLLRLNDA